jgi:hypothetical protein
MAAVVSVEIGDMERNGVVVKSQAGRRRGEKDNREKKAG